MFSSMDSDRFGLTTLGLDELMFTFTQAVSPGGYVSFVTTFPTFSLKARLLAGQFLCNKLQVSESAPG